MNDTDRERAALEVFSELCELAEPERSAMLDSRCAADSILRDRVAALLRADGEALAPLAPHAVERFLQTEVGHVAKIAINNEPPPHESLHSDYRLLRVLGEGGMATVYEAEQQHPRRLVAIKIVRGGAFSAELRRRFEYEAQVLARLQHPNIAQLYEADTQPDGESVCAYLAMELVRGLPIDDYVEKNKLSIRQRVELIVRVCDAVEYAHRMGVIHRDLKPANILVQEDGQPKILDFGVARAIDRDERLATVLTSAGQVIGTLPYMSPELVQGDRLADTRADVYALGVLLYKLLTAKLPVNVSDCGIAEAARRICNDLPSSLSASDRALGGDLEVIVCKSLEKEADRRYRSVQSLAADLRRYLQGRAIEARSGSSLYVLRKTIWRFRRITAVAAAFVGILIAFAVYAEIQSRHNRELARQAAESRDSAVQARDIASKNAEQLRRSLYFSNIGFTQAALETNDIGHVFPLLDGCPPDLRGWEWGYLRGLSDRSAQTWRMQMHQPRSFDATPDHSRLAVGCEGSAEVLTGANRDILFHRDLSDGAVAVAISPNGRWLACGAQMDELSVIDVDTGKTVWTADPLPKPQYPLLGRLRSLCFSPDGKTLAAAGYDGHLRLRDSATGAIRQDINAHCLSVLCIAFTQDSARVAGGDDRGHLHLWNTADGSTLFESTPHESSVACLTFSADQQLLASGASDGKLIIRKVSDWSEVKTLIGGRSIVWSVAFSPDGKQLASGSDDNLLRLWTIDSDTAPALLRGHADTVGFVEFESGGHLLLSAAADSTIKRWETDKIDPARIITIENAAAYDAAFTADGQHVAIIANDGTVRLWDRGTWKEVWRYQGPRTTLRSIALDTARNRIAASGDDNIIRVIGLKDGQPLELIPTGASQLRATAYSPDGKLLATGDGDGMLRLWNVETLPATQIATVHAHDGSVMSLAIHPDGVHVATGGSNGKIKFWKIGQNDPLFTVRSNNSTVRDLRFDSTGHSLAAGYSDGAIWIFDGESARPLRELRGHQGAINGLAYLPGTTRLASGGADRTVRIWDTASATQILTLHGHRRPIEHLSFSPDGSTLASASLDGTVQLWDSHSSQPAAIGRESTSP